jgi:tetratricopeptide (TPR) repeat protein
LRALIERARLGDGGLVVVEGSAGIGKTRLLAETRLLAADAGFFAMTARAGELEGDFAFGIVRQLLEPALVAAPAEERTELFSGAAELAAPLFAAAGARSNGVAPEDSFAMMHGLYWLAANFALRRPTLLVVDDLHWADEPSLRWLSYLARRLEGLALLLVVGTRPPEQARTPALVTEILTDPLATLIRPTGLSEESAATLAHELFGLELDKPFATALRSVSGGNPLYLSALLDTVAREGIEPTAENAPRLSALGGDAVSRGVSLRLSRLPTDAIALVRAAAILGDGADLRHAATLAGLEVEPAGRAASVLVECDLLRHENPLEFTHPVIRTAVYQEMSEGARLSGHRRAAQTLLDGSLPSAQAAAHLQLTLPGGDPFVVTTLREAAKSMLAQGAPEAAVAYLSRALEEPPQPEERADVLGALGIAETRTVEASRAADHLSEAFAELGDVALRPDLVLAYAQLAMFAERRPEAVKLLQQVSDRVRADRDLHERVQPLLILAALYDVEYYPVARAQWDAAIEHDAEQAIGSGVLLSAGAIEETRRGIDRARAMDLARRALATETVGTYEVLYLINAITALALTGNVEEAMISCSKVLAACRRRGDRFGTAAMLMWRGVLHARKGELLAAEEDMTAPGTDPFFEIPTPRAYRAGFLSEVLIERGATAEAETLLAQVRPEHVQPGDQCGFLLGRGRMCLETGDAERALASFREAGAIAGSLGAENPAFVPWRSRAALALRRLGQGDEALVLAREELELSHRWGAPRARSASHCAHLVESKAEPKANDACAKPWTCSPSRRLGSSTRGRWSSSARHYDERTAAARHASICALESSSHTNAAPSRSSNRRTRSWPPPAPVSARSSPPGWTP